MYKSLAFAVLVILLITLAPSSAVLAAPGFIMYEKQYDIDGLILMKIQAGSDGSGAGQHKTLVDGTGSLFRQEQLFLSRGGIIADNDSIWEAGGGSLRGLKVASAFRLPGSAEENGSGQAEQVFAVSIRSDRGETGSLSQNISAAAAVYGEDRGGFSITQSASASQGTVKRYIDLEDPVSGQYLFEDSVIKGRVDISEVLRSDNREPGFMTAAGTQPGEAENLAHNLFDDEGSAGESNIYSGQGLAYQDTLPDEEEALIIDGNEIFRSIVPLGTPLEELGLDEQLVFQSELITVKDIRVDWDESSSGEYDPEREGDYTFAGKLVFPDTVFIDGEIYIFHVVRVVEDYDEATAPANGEEEDN